MHLPTEERKFARAPNSSRRMQRRLRIPASNFGMPTTDHEDGESMEGIRRRLLVEHIESTEEAS
jgi:hypothetical protein